MRAVVYRLTGSPEVLEVVDRPEPIPGPGEVVVGIAVSGVNPTDYKSRSGTVPAQTLPFPEIVPNQDGAGTVIATGPGVDPDRVGQRVWIWEAAWQRPNGTAQERVAIPSRQAVPLPPGASFDLGASLGIPAVTAHRCLTVHEGGPDQLRPRGLAGRTVLVAGGAGAVGHAAIQLARWAGAMVIATVSSTEKAALAESAGAHHVVNYRNEDAPRRILEASPGGADIIVEVAPDANAVLDEAVLAGGGAVAAYARGGGEVRLPIGPFMRLNGRWQFVLIYTVPAAAKAAAVAAVSAAVADGALGVGREAGLPLTRFPLEQTAAAHAAVEAGTVGKVLIDVVPATAAAQA
jgi:NADPH2:quinone reductase